MEFKFFDLKKILQKTTQTILRRNKVTSFWKNVLIRSEAIYKLFPIVELPNSCARVRQLLLRSSTTLKQVLFKAYLAFLKAETFNTSLIRFPGR